MRKTRDRAKWGGVISALILVTLLGGRPVNAGDSITPEDVTGPFSWGATQATGLRNLRFSGQPDGSALDRAKADGVSVVIDLRAPSESDWPEATAAADRDLLYFNVAVSPDGPFSPEAFEQIEALLEQNDGKTILIHCSSGNRAAGWLATHLVTRHDMSVDDAVSVARKAGVTNDAIVSKVGQYIDTRRSTERDADR